MLHRTCIALVLLLSACVTTEPSPQVPAAPSLRFSNLQRAAALPWTDGGRCAVQLASSPWEVLAEQCFHALDRERIEFHDVAGRCAVASIGATLGLGICLLAAPEIIVGTVVVIGVVVVAVAIREELEIYERNASRERARPETQTRTAQSSSADRTPKPEGSGSGDFFPPLTTDSGPRRPECEPIPGPPRGGNVPHNACADRIPGNNFPGLNVFVNGKHFDALVLATGTLWEVKTDNFDIHSARSQDFFARIKLPEIRRERRLAEECGYRFAVGVRSTAHKVALEKLDKTLTIVVMDWC